jgi:hypothetical protein
MPDLRKSLALFDLQRSRWMDRNWALSASIAIWLLVLPAFIHDPASPQSNLLRLAAAIASVVLLFAQWRLYRKHSTGLHLAFLTAIVFAFSVPPTWLGLNVLQFYSLNPYDIDFMWIWWHVARVQPAVIRIGEVLIGVCAVLGILDLAMRHQKV